MGLWMINSTFPIPHVFTLKAKWHKLSIHHMQQILQPPVLHRERQLDILHLDFFLFSICKLPTLNILIFYYSCNLIACKCTILNLHENCGACLSTSSFTRYRAVQSHHPKNQKCLACCFKKFYRSQRSVSIPIWSVCIVQSDPEETAHLHFLFVEVRLDLDQLWKMYQKEPSLTRNCLILQTILLSH